jgi:hypothetical protein
VDGDILGLTPPLMLSERQREAAFSAIVDAIEATRREHGDDAR